MQLAPYGSDYKAMQTINEYMIMIMGTMKVLNAYCYTQK